MQNRCIFPSFSSMWGAMIDLGSGSCLQSTSHLLSRLGLLGYPVDSPLGIQALWSALKH